MSKKSCPLLKDKKYMADLVNCPGEPLAGNASHDINSEICWKQGDPHPARGKLFDEFSL